jgi:hypothetical protein
MVVNSAHSRQAKAVGASKQASPPGSPAQKRCLPVVLGRRVTCPAFAEKPSSALLLSLFASQAPFFCSETEDGVVFFIPVLSIIRPTRRYLTDYAERQSGGLSLSQRRRRKGGTFFGAFTQLTDTTALHGRNIPVRGRHGLLAFASQKKMLLACSKLETVKGKFLWVIKAALAGDNFTVAGGDRQTAVAPRPAGPGYNNKQTLWSFRHSFPSPPSLSFCPLLFHPAAARQIDSGTAGVHHTVRSGRPSLAILPSQW